MPLLARNTARLVPVALILLLPQAAQASTLPRSLQAPLPTGGKLSENPSYLAELPFGEEWNPTPGNQPLRFTGKERDTETGFDYFGARYYQAKWGRFTTTDPVYTWQENLVDPQRWNRYAYGRNNPLRYVDPDGRVVIAIEIPRATLERNASIRAAVAEFFGMGAPNQLPHGRIHGMVADAVLATFLPKDPNEYRANAEANLFGLVAPLGCGRRTRCRDHDGSGSGAGSRACR